MRKRVLAAVSGVAVFAGLFASSAMAAPEAAEDPFVCPVLTISDQAVQNSDRFGPIGDGTYTFAPGNAGSGETFNGNVPSIATNGDGAGEATANNHSSPGDNDYTGIWSGNEQ
jgi:hypothetical protein